MWFRSECSKVADCLWDYSARRLSTAETAQIERHLQQCARCQAESESYRQTLGMLSAVRSRPVPASQTSWHDLRPALAASRRSADLLPRLTLAGAGTALTATLLVVFFTGHGPTKRYHPTQSDGAPQAGPSARENATVPDGAVAKADPQQDGRNVFSSGLSLGSFLSGPFAPLTSPVERAVPAAVPTPIAPHHRFHSHIARLTSGGRAGKPAPTAADYAAQLDGGDVTPRSQPRNFVLSPVAVSTEEEQPTHRYVMGSIPTAQSSGATASGEGTEDGGAW